MALHNTAQYLIRYHIEMQNKTFPVAAIRLNVNCERAIARAVTQLLSMGIAWITTTNTHIKMSKRFNKCLYASECFK